MESGTVGAVGSIADGDSSVASGISSVNPSDITASRKESGDGGSADSGNSGPKRRGRPPGSGRGKTAGSANSSAAASKAPLSVNSVQFALSGIHALLAAGLSAPELALSDSEAATVAQNIVAVARHYDLQQTAKATDIGNLVVSLGIVYGGRIIRYSARVKTDAATKGIRRATGLGPAPVSNVPQNVTASMSIPIQSDMPMELAPGKRSDDMKVTAVNHPNAAGPPNGAMPVARKSTRADDILLDEHIQYVS